MTIAKIPYVEILKGKTGSNPCNFLLQPTHFMLVKIQYKQILNENSSRIHLISR